MAALHVCSCVIHEETEVPSKHQANRRSNEARTPSQHVRHPQPAQARSAEWVMRGRIRTSVCVDHAGEKGRQDVVVVVLNPIRHFPRIDQAGNHAIATRTRLSVDRNI
ncbi:hypothetical protein HYQ46_010877 [Verticillium longisporum]|nr:hypothetical protein HYQ46_010877 [Verticillium longisporum]